MAGHQTTTQHPWVYRSLADALVAFHIVWTALVFGGAIAMFIWPNYAFVEILVLSVTLLSNLPFRLACPLTLLEYRLRRKIDPEYENGRSFMATYTNKIFHTRITTRFADTAIGILYVLFYTYAVLAIIYFR